MRSTVPGTLASAALRTLSAVAPVSACSECPLTVCRPCWAPAELEPLEAAFANVAPPAAAATTAAPVIRVVRMEAIEAPRLGLGVTRCRALMCVRFDAGISGRLSGSSQRGAGGSTPRIARDARVRSHRAHTFRRFGAGMNIRELKVALVATAAGLAMAGGVGAAATPPPPPSQPAVTAGASTVQTDVSGPGFAVGAQGAVPDDG